MFDALCLSNWYVWQGVSWHDLACLVQRMLLVTHCNAFVIWACVVAATMAFDFHSGGLLPCLMPVSLYIFDRWYPDMIWHVCCGMFWHVSFCQVVYWHVLANGCVLFTWTLLTGAILSSRQDTTRACKNREKKHAGLAGFSDNPYLTTPTQHVMVGITRSKVFFFSLPVGSPGKAVADGRAGGGKGNVEWGVRVVSRRANARRKVWGTNFFFVFLHCRASARHSRSTTGNSSGIES